MPVEARRANDQPVFSRTLMEDDVGIPDGMLRRPSERSAADAGIFAVAADGW